MVGSNLFATCSYDKTVKVFNKKTLKCISELSGISEQVYSLLYMKCYDFILVGLGNGQIYCYKNFKFKFVLTGHKQYRAVSGMKEYHESQFFSYGSDE